ncbi:MAG TPA: TonB-dependent receptor, partial [Longimicrobiales bacterium]|nr:TonB-dependent receptor [Longimicrobiales bacterium]
AHGGGRLLRFTDGTGTYTLEGVPAGEARLRVTHPGYEPLSLVVTVPAGDTVVLDLELDADPVELPSLEVLAEGVEPPSLGDVRVAGGALPEVELQALGAETGVGQPGLADVVRALPGNDPADATDVLYMRGSTTDMKLVLLDGVPVYTPFHVAGLLRSFEPAVLGSADLHVGGAPARYDGGLSEILELRTREPRRDRMRVSGAVDLLSASGALETPLGGRAGVLVSGRSLHDLGSAVLGTGRPYGYRDALLAASLEPAEGHEIRLTGFLNEETVVLDPARAPDDARWANEALALTWAADLGGARMELTAGLSGYNAELPLAPSGGQAPLQLDALLASGETDRARVVGEVEWGRAAAPVRAGLSFEEIDAAYAARSLGGGPSAYSHGATRAFGAFVDVTRPLAPGLTLRGGLRADHYAGRRTLLAPRGALTWEVAPDALLTVAAGRYHQPTRTPQVEVERTLIEVAAMDFEPGELLPIATADHVVLALDQTLAGRVRLGLQGFWKRYSGLPEARDETVRSSGVDVRVLTSGERGTAWLGYELSWFWSTTDLSGRTIDFSGRHLLSAGMSGRLAGPLNAEVRLAYGAGLPYTSIPFTGGGEATLTRSVVSESEPEPVVDPPLVSALEDDFLRVDVELHALFEPTWGGRTWQVRPYVRILNALDQRDAMFWVYQPWRSERLTPIAERSLLPIAGVAFSF